MRSLRSILALGRAAIIAAASYRLSMFLSLASLVVTVVPLYFVAGALQPVVAESIAGEGGQYFGFLIVGTASLYLLSAAVGAVPGALGASIGNGTFEAMLATRTGPSALLLGLSVYPVAWSALRAFLLLGGAAVIGVPVFWSALPAAVIVLILLGLAYFAIGLMAGACILLFRTSGPLLPAVIAGSGLLGGAYYSTTVIPSWLRDLSGVVPLSYALRPLRRLLLTGEQSALASSDLGMLALLAITLLSLGTLAFGFALRRARSAGTLAQY